MFDVVDVYVNYSCVFFDLVIWYYFRMVYSGYNNVCMMYNIWQVFGVRMCDGYGVVVIQ